MAETTVPRHVYYRVFAALLTLTLLTWGMSYVKLGETLSFLVAITIAVGKASLVALFFMHVRYSNHRTWLFVSGGIFWLLLLMGLTMSDYLTRGWYAVVGW